MMSRKVFMSYSWKDMLVATRLYDDLSRSYISVWRDQVDGDPTEDFLEEFLSKIDACDDFIVLDSINYRKKSNWCMKEIERCFENRLKRNAPRVIVCLLNKDGDWRWDFKNNKEKNIFSQLNMFKYQELFYEGVYDNDSVYLNSIVRICSLFNQKFIPWDELPESQDFIDELSVENLDISNAVKKLLMDEYNIIQRIIRLQRNPQRHFELWLDDCKQIGGNLFFPVWTYCIWLGHRLNSDKNEDACIEQFQWLIHKFPKDPRGFRGLASLLARKGRYAEAEKALKHVISLFELPENKRHKNYSEFEVLLNLAQILINRGQLHEAIHYLESCLSISNLANTKYLPMVLNYNYCLVAENKLLESKMFLSSIYDQYSLDDEFQSTMGLTLSALGENQSAYFSFKRAYMLTPSVKNAFFLLGREYALGMVSDKKTFINRILSKEPICSDDNYWKGAICFYFLNDIKRSREYYNKSSLKYDWYQ